MLALVLAGAELGILLGPAPIRVPAGLIVAFLPGLAITRAIQTRTRIEGTEQLLLVPGISLAVAVIETALKAVGGTGRSRLGSPPPPVSRPKPCSSRSTRSHVHGAATGG